MKIAKLALNIACDFCESQSFAIYTLFALSFQCLMQKGAITLRIMAMSFHLDKLVKANLWLFKETTA